MAAERVAVRIESERLEARICVEPGPVAGIDELRAALERAGVVYGVDEARCAQLASALANPDHTARDELIASGSAPEPGRNGVLEPHFPIGLQPGTERDDGSIDFLDRALLTPVDEGALIATYHPATLGIEGTGVDGKVIPTRTAQETLPPLGPGVVHDAASGEIRARFDGAVTYQEEKGLDVIDYFEHGGDVNLRSGNLNIQGGVLVTGSINAGLRVRASGDVVVKTGIDGGSAEAGGSVGVTGGILGGTDGEVRAGGDVSVRHAHGARIHCGGLLTVADAVDCRLRGREIQATGKVLGGELEAETRIVVSRAGSPFGARTVLRAASLVEDSPCRADGGEQRRAELLASARIEIVDVAHAGVVIELGSARLQLEEEVRRVRFRRDHESGEILAEPIPT